MRLTRRRLTAETLRADTACRAFSEFMKATSAEMTGSVAASVFASHPPDLIGPIKTEQGWNLFKVTRIHKPTLAESESRIRMELMQQLIDRLLAEAALTYPVFETL